ncbi:peptidoglycan-binding protein [Dactylosporangium sp. NPDC051541]|uniref:peptidoglycan-binding protein n=1 Tax=Dactylosporangium sp. NPDC051541 TaxID=3363977 RepID=UPI0037A306A1
MRRLLWAGLAVVVCAGIFWAYTGFNRDTAPAAAAPSQHTATITKGTLTATEQVDGTLGFGDPVMVNGRLPGTITALPAEGSTIHRGEAMYRADGRPVLLFYAAAPFYRALKSGDEGEDVRAFEANLAALGYTGFTADDSYTGATADAVRDWQESLGLPETGTVELGRIVIAPDAVRVGEVKAHLGDNSTGPILQWTGSTRLVTVQLDVTEQRLAAVGAEATVKLPDDSEVPGKIAAIGAVATATVQNNQTKVTVDVTVTIADQAKLGTYDAAPVRVTLVSEQRKDVLTVPVNALVALAEGGYGLQIVTDGATRTVAVKTGLFASGRVEVSGADVTAGLTVGVAA